MTHTSPFDAVVVISFGGPGRLEDVRPFLANVLRGRQVPPDRVEEVAHHYALFDGVSPLTELTRRQATALEERLRTLGLNLPVFVGMRNWDPFLVDTLTHMSRQGIRRAVGFIAAAHRSYSSCQQYRENVVDAQRTVRERGHQPPDVIYVSDWHTHAGFIGANVAHIAAARASLPTDRRDAARLVFTAHSLPVRMPGVQRYQDQLNESARLVAETLGWNDWTLVYQSRSGRPQDPWLGPDILEYLREEHTKGLRAVVLSPIGFLCDHVEVLYDLDREAAAVCREHDISVARAESVNDHPLFVATMADAVAETVERYARGRPLVIAPSELRPTRPADR